MSCRSRSRRAEIGVAELRVCSLAARGLPVRQREILGVSPPDVQATALLPPVVVRDVYCGRERRRVGARIERRGLTVDVHIRHDDVLRNGALKHAAACDRNADRALVVVVELLARVDTIVECRIVLDGDGRVGCAWQINGDLTEPWQAATAIILREAVKIVLLFQPASPFENSMKPLL